MASALEIGKKLMAMSAWESRGDVDSMWDTTVSCIRETAREVASALEIGEKLMAMRA